MRWAILALAAAAALSGCAFGEEMHDLRPGMSEAQVIDKLGRPDGVQNQGDTEVLTYSNRRMERGSRDRADYLVVLKDGRVASFGPTAVRQNAGPNMMLLMGIPTIR